MKGKKRRKIITVCILVAAAGALLGLYTALSEQLIPSLFAVGEPQLQNIALRVMNNAVRETLHDRDVTGLVHVSKDGEGKIAMIQADSAALNEIAVSTALAAQEKLTTLGEGELSVPLGNVMGLKFLSGHGPPIRIRIQPVGTVETGFLSEFETEGINQTRYRIYIVLKANMRMMVGAGVQTVEAQTQVLISESILIGNVPSTYANVPGEDSFLNLVP